MLGRTVGMVWIALLLGCGGPNAGGPGPNGPRVVDNDDADDDDDDDQHDRAAHEAHDDRDLEQRLRGLVEEVVGLSEGTDCTEFGRAITRWTDTHADDVDALIKALDESEDDAALAELDAYVETRRLVVLEAAADCGDFDDAWPAWQHFEAMVDNARE